MTKKDERKSGLLYSSHRFVSGHITIHVTIITLKIGERKNIGALTILRSYWIKNHMKIFRFMIFYAKSLRIVFDKTDGFNRIYDRSRYLVLFSPEKWNTIYNKIGYLINLKRDITHVFCQ